jgi:hypothetical protein
MKKTFCIIILFAMMVTFSCKRFPDGPRFSLRTMKGRVTGTWQVDKFYIDGADSTEEYYQKLGCNIEFFKETYKYNDQYHAKLSSCNDDKSLPAYWKFYHNNIMDITYQAFIIWFDEDTTFNSVGPFKSNGSYVWKILRLTNKEFNLTTDNMEPYFSEPIYLLKLKK